jgi:hypothetical protein
MNKELFLGYMLETVERQVKKNDADIAKEEGWDGKGMDDHDPRTDDLNAQILEHYLGSATLGNDSIAK